MAGWATDKTPRQWRTHFHVPVFLEDLGPLKSTRFALEQALAMHKKTPLSRHLEIETYTWDVLPDHLKTGDIVEYVCRELEWVKGQARIVGTGQTRVKQGRRRVDTSRRRVEHESAKEQQLCAR